MRLTEKKDSGHWSLKGVSWDDLKPGTVLTKKILEKLYGALWKLKDYEDTGLSPEEVESVNDFEKSQTYRAIAELQEEREKHRWIPVTERFRNLVIMCCSRFPTSQSQPLEDMTRTKRAEHFLLVMRQNHLLASICL